jgi:hypothetical protein
VPVVIFLAAAVILGGVVVVAMGRGGELERSPRELASRLDFRTWSDVARYRPPAALLGYHAAATEHALAVIARTIAERDAEIDWLRRRLAETDPQVRPPVVAASAEGNPRVAAAGNADRRVQGATGEGSLGENDGTAQRPGGPGRHEFLASPTESPAAEIPAEESRSGDAGPPAGDDGAAGDVAAVVSPVAESPFAESPAAEIPAEDAGPSAGDDGAAGDVAAVVSPAAKSPAAEIPAEDAGPPAGSDDVAADFAAVVSDAAGTGDAAGVSGAAAASDDAEAGGGDEVGSLAVANGTAPKRLRRENVAAGAVSAAGPADGGPRDEGE